ncbi:hypothetical protein WICPIJ_004931 [Wickerhamomyces pijperi]|uniref:Uncharacterized protein n=1 Tax=Wickerhamomyces pijperi TaxID=599730 RepID=A0A9P8Q4I2_WICPI|nr:hypothetical protein WICPIJ_004931 [Wickerhamomyces pijperi]
MEVAILYVCGLDGVVWIGKVSFSSSSIALSFNGACKLTLELFKEELNELVPSFIPAVNLETDALASISLLASKDSLEIS